MRGRLLAVASVAAAISCGGGVVPGGPGLPGGPTPPPRGGTQAASTSATIDAAGGSFSLTDDTGVTLTVAVPPNAVAAATSFTLTSISNTAPGGLGNAFRLGAPAATQLAAALTLTWTMPAGSTVDQVTAADQDTTGYWFRVYNVSRDTTAQTLSVQTLFIGDWSLVSLASSRDLHGPFRLDSTQDIPFTATGEVTLQWLGDDSSFAYYLPQGDITLQVPLTKASGATCNPTGPAAQTMPMSVAEIRNIPTPVQWRWGINGRWDLTCSDGSTDSLGTNFDSLGITNIGCVRNYVGVPVIDETHVAGQYLIDCTQATPRAGKVVGSWDFVLPGQTPGPLPPPPAPWP